MFPSLTLNIISWIEHLKQVIGSSNDLADADVTSLNQNILKLSVGCFYFDFNSCKITLRC